jgi:hypothetical protein
MFDYDLESELFKNETLTTVAAAGVIMFNNNKTGYIRKYREKKYEKVHFQ